MKLKILIFSLVMGCLGFYPTIPALAQDEDVRGAFLTTRPKPVAKSPKGNEGAKPNRRRPKVVPPKASEPDSGAVKPISKTNEETPKPIAQKLGLGLTLFTRDAHGLAVRADPTRVFRKGDRVRVLLETNADGYLYIFNTTNDGKPVLVYPDKELDEGGNYIQSHVPFEIPASTATEERLRWLVFDEFAGTERLYFVFTREPLAGIPLEEELVAFCSEKNKCPIQPSAELWTEIQKDPDTPLQVAASSKYGKAQTEPEREAVARGMGLSKEEPEPSLIMMTASSKSGRLVAVLDLVHK